MATAQDIPSKSYGVLKRGLAEDDIDEIVEQVRSLGYAVLESRLGADALRSLSETFERTRERYIDAYGETKLKAADEYWTIRAPLTLGGSEFLALALNERLLSVVKRLILGKFILNQQNGVINPPGETYNQSAWHRDLPYQHFISSAPIAVNALFCVDEFTTQNGGTFVLPASHKVEAFPSANYVARNALQLEAPAGSFILLDCMLFHAGGFNRTASPRCAVNQVYTIPFFKQQINIPFNLKNSESLSGEVKDILGFNHSEPETIADYIARRRRKE
jgi:ectoine hydroxylase-related dioxygenase (phytanoyl-CoA dioxygenase family)